MDAKYQSTSAFQSFNQGTLSKHQSALIITYLHDCGENPGSVLRVGSCVYHASHCNTYTVSQKISPPSCLHYNFFYPKPILIISGRDLADRICYQR